MASQTIRYTRRRVKKGKGGNGYVVCNMCHGTGYHKAPQKKKAKREIGK